MNSLQKEYFKNKPQFVSMKKLKCEYEGKKLCFFLNGIHFYFISQHSDIFVQFCIDLYVGTHFKILHHYKLTPKV